MTGKSPLLASEEQRTALTALAGSRDRGEADRARAVLLTLAGWTSPRIAEAFGVREDTVRLWRSDFMGGGVEAPLPQYCTPNPYSRIQHLLSRSSFGPAALFAVKGLMAS